MASKIRTLKIGLIPGDGIGKEVIPAGRRLLEALPSRFNLKFEFVDLEAGFECFQRNGKTAFPERTKEVLQNECQGALFGAVSSPSTPTPGYSSPIVALRKSLNLYANVRPVASVTPLSTSSHASTIQSKMYPSKQKIDMVIVRENTEDIYVKEERTFPDPSNADEKIAEAIKRISSVASARIARAAGDIALRRQRLRAQSQPGEEGEKEAKVTITHKSNVLPHTDGLFRSTCRSVLSAPEYASNIKIEEQIIDSMVYKLFRQPWDYDVIVAPNFYGDILSDGAAALVGSLGVVPSANVGEGIVIGEPCHGSAPDIEGKGIANPIATLRSVGLMLEFLGEEAAGDEVRRVCDANLAEGRVATPDLGGRDGMEDVVQDVLRRLE